MELIANAGTPLIWAGCFTLFFGNWLIGLAEAKLLSRYLKKRVDSSWLIAANYVSMAVGVGVMSLAGPIRESVELDPIALGMRAFAILVLMAFVVTVVVELPFIARATELRTGFPTFRLSVMVQLATYAAMLLLTYLLGSISALTGLRKADKIPTVGGWLYTIGLDDQTIYRTRLDGSRSERVGQLKVKPRGADFSRLVVEPMPKEDRARLIFVNNGDVEEMQKSLGRRSQAAPIERTFDGKPNVGNKSFGHWSTRAFVKVPKVYAGYWPVEGIRIDGRHYGLESPVLVLSWRSPIVLPDGKVVAQFGRAVYLIDPESRTAMKLAEGRSGDVLIDLPAKG
jgi:hypothetical protein